MLDLLFLKKFKSLNIYFSNESSVTQISVSGRPWNDLFLDGGLRPNTCNFGGPYMEKFENHGFGRSI